MYFDQQGGTRPSNDYDFYSVVEHETDEVLGKSSCMDTNGTISDGCGGTTPSAVELFRYYGAANLVLNSACIGVGSTPTVACPTGAYFSYNGGVTNRDPNGSVYNTIANGNDYADFVANTCGGGGPYHVQDGTGCPGTNPFLNNDGAPARGFNSNLVPVTFALGGNSGSADVVHGAAALRTECSAGYGRALPGAKNTWSVFSVLPSMRADVLATLKLRAHLHFCRRSFG